MLFLLKSKTPKMEKFFQDFAFKFYQIIFFYLKKLEISEVFVLLILALTLKSKTRKTQNIFQVLEISKQLICLRRMKISSFPSFQFWPLYWNWKLWKLWKVSKFLVLALMVKLKTPGIWKIFQDLQFSKNLFYLRKSRIFDISEFLILVLILKSKIHEKLEIISKLANIKAGVLFEEVRSFWSFWIFYFGTYGEIENFKMLESSSRLINFK